MEESKEKIKTSKHSKEEILNKSESGSTRKEK